MSVADRDNLLDNVENGHDPIDTGNGRCYYCGQTLSRVFVHWWAEPNINLHPECAIQLGIMLIVDGGNAQKIANGTSAENGVGRSLQGWNRLPRPEPIAPTLAQLIQPRKD